MTTDDSGTPSAGAGRRRGAGASREALLTAARELFAAHGYDRTTVRAIADRAGVNQALLFRYFGSKDELFSATLAESARALLATPPAELLRATLSRMLADNPAGGDGALFFAALRSAGHDGAAAAVRDELGADYGAAFASLARTGDAADAALRADLLLAWLLGIGLLRSVLAKEPLAGADPAVVTGHVVRAADALLAD